MNPPFLNPVEFMAFTLILIRVSVILFLAPIFGSDLIPAQVKVALGLVLSLMLSSFIKVDTSVFPRLPIDFAVIIIREVTIGLALALIIRFVLEGVQFAAQFIGYQMGFAIVNVVDPQSGNQLSVLSQFAYILALIVFLSTNAHHLIVRALIESFQLAPPGLPVMPAGVLQEIITRSAGLFVIAIKIGAPALAVLFFTKVAMGIVAKTVPQMNVLFVGMPLYILLGLSIFGLSITFIIPLLGRAFGDAGRSMAFLLQAF